MQFVGIDWAYRRASFCVLDEAGAILQEVKLPAAEDGLAHLVARVGPDVRGAWR